MWKVFIAHAEGEQAEAEKLARPLVEAGYEVAHHGTLLVGESLLDEARRVLGAGGPVVICGTCRAAGSRWIRRISQAARKSGAGRLFVMQMEGDADVEDLVLDERAGNHWQDPEGAVRSLLAALRRFYPLGEGASAVSLRHRAEATYRRLALDSCDLISLANLPGSDRHIATRRLELRRLYVPLRVRPEEPASAQQEGRDPSMSYRARLAGSFQQLVLDLESLGRAAVGTHLATTPRLVILGDPGAGKSTLLNWIATAYLLRLKRDPDLASVPDVATLPDKDWLPILIRCRDLEPDAVEGRLDDVLWHTLRKQEMPEEEAAALRSVLRDKLAQDEAILLVDGLDEITNMAARIRFCELIEKLQNAFPNAPMVVTSRIVGYREMGYHHRISRGFEHFIVDDLSSEEKDDFVRRWCELTEAPERKHQAAEELIRDIHSTDRIESLTDNPMLLTTMALVKRSVGMLPRRRAELYWAAVLGLLNWRQAEAEEPLDAREARPQLQYLAYAMCHRGVQRLREDEVLTLLRQLRAEHSYLHAVGRHSPEQFLDLLERRTGILVRMGHVWHLGMQAAVYEFRHLTFQEYLAARALVEQCFPGARPGSLAATIAPLSTLHAQRDDSSTPHEPNWREVIRLFVACCPSAEVDSVMRAILEVQPGEDAAMAGPSRAALAALCLVDEPDVSAPLVHEVLERLRRFIQYDETFSERINVFCELMNSRWREQALTVLGQEFLCREARSRGPVLSILDSCGSTLPEVTEEMEKSLLAALCQPADDVKVVLAATRLSELASKGWEVAGAVPHLLDLLGRRGAVSHAAAYALHGLFVGYRDGLWSPDAEECRRLMATVADPCSDPGAVQHVIRILGWQQTAHAFEHLVSRLADAEADVRQAAANALGWSGDVRGGAPLIDLLEDPSPEVRAAAAEALGLLRAPEAFLPLRRKLRDEGPGVRTAVLGALKRLLSLGARGAARTPSPGNLPGWTPEEVSELAREFISLLEASPASNPLRATPYASGFPDDAVMMLGLLKPEEAVGPLLRYLQSLAREEDGWSRSVAMTRLIRALGELRNPSASAAIREALDASEPAVQAAAAVALGKLGDPRAVEWLGQKVWGDEEETALEAYLGAAAGLARLGDTRGFAILKDALQADEEDVRRGALGALAGGYGDEVDEEWMTLFVRDHGFLFDPRQGLEATHVELLAKRFFLPPEEVRHRVSRFAERVPLKLVQCAPLLEQLRTQSAG